jgi:hypothetical protein
MKTVSAILFGLGVCAVLLLLFGVAAMLLWNWLMPVIFRLPTITFWQAYGLLWLIRLFVPSSMKVNSKTE